MTRGGGPFNGFQSKEVAESLMPKAQAFIVCHGDRGIAEAMLPLTDQLVRLTQVHGGAVNGGRWEVGAGCSWQQLLAATQDTLQSVDEQDLISKLASTDNVTSTCCYSRIR